MLASAVQKSKTAQQQEQSKTLGQRIFSSSPPGTSATATNGSFGRAGGHGGQPLRPASPSKVNGKFYPASHKAHQNTLKRTSSGISTGSNGSMGSRKFSSQGRQHAVPAPLPRTSSVLNTLHADPVWDDFPDDADVFLDETPFETAVPAKALNTGVSYPTLPSFEPVYPQGDLEYPKLPEIPQKTPTQTRLQSSSAIPWSSSPLEHKRPGEAIEFKRPQAKPAAVKSEARSVEVIDLDADDVQPPPAKRRTLPWMDQGAQVAASEATTGSKRMKRPKQERDDTSTATPTAKKADTYAWNQTASAVKAEQKRLREATSSKNTLDAPQGEENHEGTGPRKAKSKEKTVSPVFLSEEQKRVLDLVVNQQQSVFFTGSAGTGKSVLMREIISELRKTFKNEPDRVAVTASTGLAACNIGGNTLHSFAGIGLGKETVEQLCKKIKRNQKAVQRWTRTKFLVIDEISMIDGALFDKLEGIARTLRRKAVPFGGMKLVITGDFFQLPPVGDSKNPARFSFDATTWNTCITHTIGLTHVFRQKDPEFAGMLNEMRIGKLTPQSVIAFQKLARPLVSKEQEDVEATELFSTRNEVDTANQLRLKRLGGTTVDLAAQDGGTIADVEQRNKLLSNCMAPQMITLKKGAQVMLIKNIDDTLVNGSIGKVIAFMDEKTFDYYDEHEEEFLSTQPSMDADVKRPDIKGFMNPGAGNAGQKWPVVRFQIADGTSRDLLCQREQWKIEQPNGEVLASRSQIPLILAWALSIHKAQGQTIPKVRVDLRRVFEKGQAYVALSRATTQEGLQVIGFNATKVQAHERVRKFYDSLYAVDTIQDKPGLAPPTKKDRVKTSMYETDFPYGADEADLLRQMPI